MNMIILDTSTGDARMAIKAAIEIFLEIAVEKMGEEKVVKFLEFNGVPFERRDNLEIVDA